MTTSTRTSGHRRRGSLSACAVVAALTAAALPAAADAARITDTTRTLVFVAAPGERNAVSISRAGPFGQLVVRDTGGAPLIEQSPLCFSVSLSQVNCDGSLARASVFLGDKNDVYANGSAVPAGVFGEVGDDTYANSVPAFVRSAVVFSGGPGRDTAAYTRTGQAGSFEVRVSKDNAANDGRIDTASSFRDADSIQDDVERLIGSPMRDVLDGSGVPSSTQQIFEGLGGDDTLRGGNGNDVFLSPTADGADVISGAAGRDVVDYSQRTRPVTVRLANGVADDGEAGERDEVSLVEIVRGGREADELIAPSNTLDAFELSGGPGEDLIEGGARPDTLDGGPGVDIVKGLGGSDRLLMRDGQFDSFIDCGEGVSDSVVVDEIDKRLKLHGCERVFSIVGRPRLVPKTHAVGAGGVVRAALSWTHPRDWRKLDEVELLLEHRGRRVARIVFDQESRRTRGGGGGVRLISSRSAVRPTSARGRRVRIRLALRIARRHAGRTLVVMVAARDDDGSRQPAVRAGRIRVDP